MALTVCKECKHEVSDKAPNCPHCGAPVAISVQGKRRLNRILYGVLAALVVLWVGVSALWLGGAIGRPSQLLDTLRGRDHAAAPAHVSVQAVQPMTPVMAAAPPADIHSAARSVYHTSAEQLYSDYNANAVAMQNKIGDSEVRITGSVADINQDESGHPIVTLGTGADGRADMILTSDQRTAVAQLSKGDTVDIQCTRMQRVASAPRGSDCALVLLDAGSKQVYLAVFLTNGSGNAPTYIVGPMSQGTCLSHGDSISAQLNANPRTDHLATRNCAATARENIPLEGCHLSTTMSSIPDVPSAHLWKYECGSPTVVARKSSDTRKGRKRVASEPVVDDLTDGDTPEESSGPHVAAPTPAPAVSAPAPSAPTPPPALPQAPAVSAAVLAATTPPSIAVSAPATPAVAPSGNIVPGNIVVAAAPASAAATVTPTSTAATAAPASLAAAVPQAPAAPSVPDDLQTVRATDPGAAEHIASYCNTATAQAADHVTVAAGCRHAEAGAWTRLVLNNEFPSLDDAARRRCNEAPFPDSYVAKESCAKYQLHIN